MLTQCMQCIDLLVLAMLLPIIPLYHCLLPLTDIHPSTQHTLMTSLKYQPAPDMQFAQTQQLDGSPRRPVFTLIFMHNHQRTIGSRRTHANDIPMHGKHPTLATLAQHKQAAVKVKDIRARSPCIAATLPQRRTHRPYVLSPPLPIRTNNILQGP